MMVEIKGRILGIDPGEKRTGIAVSDPTQTISSALGVVEHQSRIEAARKILALAAENEVVLILIGCPLDPDGKENPQSRKSSRLAELIQQEGTVSVLLWDEYGSTQLAQQTGRDMNLSRQQRSGHLDQIAAAIILQDYLDSIIDPEEQG